MRLLMLCALIGFAASRENDWQPIVSEASGAFVNYPKTADRSVEAEPQLKILNRRPLQPSYTSNKLTSFYNIASAPSSDSCSVYKVSMNQELFYQYVEYDKELPDLKEFTLCMWSKFHNHSDDHPLFSYAVDDNPKEISSWISNTQEASFYSMAVHGQTFFRLNYPVKLNTWYHTCQSWNGKTGEWQMWVNGERVGRGFHNRLVGHVIKGGGVAISGQEQSLLYNKDGLDPVIKQSGLMGEITMLQMYHVALTAGKAHKDHKHHHAHHFKHDGSPLELTTEVATEPPSPQATPLGNGNFLIGGQLQRAPNLNLAGAQQQIIPVQLSNGLQIHQQYLNGQLGNRIVSEQLINGGQPSSASQIPLVGLSITPLPQISNYSPRQTIVPSKSSTVLLSGSLSNPANVQYVEGSLGHKLFKRDSTKRDKRDNPEKALNEEQSSAQPPRRHNIDGNKGAVSAIPNVKKDKRGLIALSDGSVVDEALLTPSITDDNEDAVFERSLLQGLAGVVGNIPVQKVQKQNSDDREPAEAEVKAVMQVCSGCVQEPFKKALVLSWRATPKKLYSGAHYYKGLPICRAF